MSVTETECPCCVICLVEIEDNSINFKSNSNKKLIRKFLQFVECRLKVAEFNFSRPRLCERCSEVASNLCELYKELRSIETRMFLKLEEMEAILSMERVTDATKLKNTRGRAEVKRFREILTRQVLWYFDVERSTKSKEDDIDSDSGPDSEIKDEPEPSQTAATDETVNEDYEDDDGANSESDINMDDTNFIENEDISSTSSDFCSMDEYEDDEEEAKHEFDFNEEEDPLKIEIEVQSHTEEEPQHQQPTVTNQSHGKRSRKSAVIPRQDFDEFSVPEVEVMEVPPVPSTSSFKNQYQNVPPHPKALPQKRLKMGDYGMTEKTERDWSSRRCGICKESFVAARDLGTHMYEHEVRESKSRSNIKNPKHKKKPDFQCPFCPKVYFLEESWKVHIEIGKRIHATRYFPDLRFRCDGENGENECCTETYETLTDLGLHLKTCHPGATIYHCGTCKWPLLNESARDLHQLNHISRVGEDVRTKNLHCSFPNCPIFSSATSSIVGHFSKDHGTGLRPYRCPQSQCTYRGYTIYHVNQHLEVVHQTTTLNDKPVEFLCDICSVKSFKTLQKLKTHQKGCRKTGICDICGEKLLTSKELENHKLEVHQVEPPRFVCDQCGKVLQSEARRILHLRHHEKRKVKRDQLLCPQCGKAYHYERSLKQHIENMHVKETTGEERKRDSMCQDCGKAYFKTEDLTRHRVMNHLSEEEKQKRRDRLKCPLCQKGFLILDYLKGHIRKVHKVDPNEALNTSKWNRLEVEEVKGNKKQTEENATKTSPN